MKKIFIILIIILMILAVSMYFLKKDKNSITTSKVQGKNIESIISNNIRIGIIDMDNINPILSNNKHVQEISRLIFEPLFTLTQDYKLEGVLAKEYSKIDEKTYIIKLKENITWHNGDKFNCSDVIFTINTLKKLNTDSIYYYNVKEITKLQEIDEYTLKITTNSDILYFEYNLIFPIISKKYFKTEDIRSETKNIKPVGTGMFYISDVNNSYILLKKNIQNERALELKIDTITLNLYDSLSSVIKAFKTEEIDMFTTANINIEEYLKNINYNSYRYINRNYSYIALNCENSILQNKEVRQAISFAINKEEILKEVFNNKYVTCNFPLDFRSYEYNINNEINTYDENKAKNILLENGWKYSKNGWTNNKNLKIELDLVVNKSDNNMIKVAKNIEEQLKRVGILVDIKEASNKQYNNYLRCKDYDMIILDTVYGYSPSLQKYFGEDNLANYDNKEINNLLNELSLTYDEEEKEQKYKRIYEIYNLEVPYISLYYTTNTVVCLDTLKGRIKPNSYNIFYELETWYREYKK